MSNCKRILILVTCAFGVAVVSCFSNCRDMQRESLRFVGDTQAKPDRQVPTGLVVVTHGWVEKGKNGWPEDMAMEISNRVDVNDWVCGYFDWSKGAMTIDPTKAAKYGRDVAGLRLAEEIMKSGGKWQHIHLIGHSSGCWVVSEAAKILATKTKADIHLTFFDAYVPSGWQEDSLGNIGPRTDANYWADHYYTRDYTLKWTQQDLSYAHNVDVTDVDQGLKDHNFPWKWYHASVTGKYPVGHFLNNRKLVLAADGIEYGFARSREGCDWDSWKKSLQLPTGNKAVKVKKQVKQTI